MASPEHRVRPPGQTGHPRAGADRVGVRPPGGGASLQTGGGPAHQAGVPLLESGQDERSGTCRPAGDARK